MNPKNPMGSKNSPVAVIGLLIVVVAAILGFIWFQSPRDVPVRSNLDEPVSDAGQVHAGVTGDPIIGNVTGGPTPPDYRRGRGPSGVGGPGAPAGTIGVGGPLGPSGPNRPIYPNRPPTPNYR